MRSLLVRAFRQDTKGKEIQRQSSQKRPFAAADSKGNETYTLRGPGGGAIEGPPLLGRVSAGSAHGGLEYYRCHIRQHPTVMYTDVPVMHLYGHNSTLWTVMTADVGTGQEASQCMEELAHCCRTNVADQYVEVERTGAS